MTHNPRRPRRTKMSRVEGGVRLMLEYNEALNHRDVDGLLALLTDDCAFTSHSPAPAGATFAGKEAIAGYWQAFFAAHPAARFEVEEVFGLGFRCVLRWALHLNETDSGLKGVDVFRIKDGRIEEVLSYVKG